MTIFFYFLEKIPKTIVTPAQAGAHSLDIILDSRLRGNDNFPLLVNSFEIRGLSKQNITEQAGMPAPTR